MNDSVSHLLSKAVVVAPRFERLLLIRRSWVRVLQGAGLFFFNFSLDPTLILLG